MFFVIFHNLNYNQKFGTTFILAIKYTFIVLIIFNNIRHRVFAKHNLDNS